MLGLEEAVYSWSQFAKARFVRLGYRAGNNQRGTRFIDEDGVNLIHNGEEVFALDELIGFGYKRVIAQVIKSKLVVRSVGYVCPVSRTPAFRMRIIFVDYVDRHAQEFKHRAHPFGVTLGEVRVHGNEVNTASHESIQIYRRKRNKGFTFPGFHLCNFPLMDCNAAEQLHVVLHHVPLNFGAGSFPCSASHALTCHLYNSKDFRHYVVKHIFYLLKPLFFELVEFI